MRLIDGDKLIEAIDKWQDTLSLETTAIDCVICDVLDSVVMIIDDMETVEEGGNCDYFCNGGKPNVGVYAKKEEKQE